ncbi:MAG: hypothetical protein M1837_001059 [Sclerophora amabilis]|nr:MAG: hypothetical protein M1837_001059 [Sclerophora amabilis]
MSSSSSGPLGHLSDPSEPSSSQQSPLQPTVQDDSDAEDHVSNRPVSHDLLSTGSLGRDLDNRISFKRKQKSPAGFVLPKFLSSPLSTSRQGSPSPQPSPSRYQRGHNRSPSHFENRDTSSPVPNGGTHTQITKESEALDWYIEGPGRRVGYDDLTAIDWIFEYNKERQRLRVLYSNATGILGSLRLALDASQIWCVLIITGVTTGLLAAAIDVASDWLGDLKTGYCKNGVDGGKFYLNKGFCCWELEGKLIDGSRMLSANKRLFGVGAETSANKIEWSQCQDWTSWSSALHVQSRGGKYLIEYIFFVAYSVVFAAFASILVKSYAIYARQSGIPEIKTVLGGFVIRRFMGTWTLIIKCLGLCLAVSSGLWLGKEGPLVHVACCCANLAMKLFDTLGSNEGRIDFHYLLYLVDKRTARKREVLSAAAAAGISVAFGSPIGGVLFSLEQLSYYFPDKTMWQSFVCAMVAAVTLQAFNPFRTGKLVLYQVTYKSSWHGFEMVPFALLGVLGGLYGAIFIKLNMKIAQWRKSSPLTKRPVTEVILVALFTAFLNYPNVFMRAQSSELVYFLFAECSAVPDDQFGLCATSTKTAIAMITLLLCAAVLGLVLASITFGLQIPAGIILPSMAIGALFGRALGLFVQILQKKHPTSLIFSTCEAESKIPCITPGTYAIIGAASALGGVTRMTVSIVVIMFELTGALTYVLPIMIAVMLSKWVGDALGGRRGIYESWIHLNGYPFLENNETTMPDIPVSQIMTRIEDLVVLTATGHTIETLNELLSTQSHRGFPVISDTRDAILLGYISRAELTFALSSSMAPPRRLPAATTETYFAHQPLADSRSTLDLRPWMDQTPITLSSKSSLHVTVSLFQKLGLRYVLFCDKGVLQGLMTKKDVWYVLDGAEETDSFGESVGVLRSEGRGQQRGLLGDEREREGTEGSASS